MHQHRLGLIIGVVTDGDDPRANVARRPAEEGVAHAARRLLDCQALALGDGGQIDLLHSAWEAPIRRQLSDEGRVRIGVRAPNPVMKMGNVQGQIQRRGQSPQKMQERHRIGAAGDAHDDRRAGGEQVMGRDVLFCLL